MSDSDCGSEAGSEAEEPLFKYSRLTKFPRTFFSKDPVSAVLITDALVAVGTHSGVLHLAHINLDAIRTTRIHRASISDISSDNMYVATASIDGTVVISSIEDGQDVNGADMRRPVQAVAINPQYAEQSRNYLSGGTSGAVTLSSRGWIKARSDTVLEQTTGAILAIEWHKNRVLWCSEEGITVYDPAITSIRERISRLPNSGRADMYRPRIYMDETTALVAWGKAIYFINLGTATLERTLELPWIIAGISKFKQDLLVLCCEPCSPPEIRVIDGSGQEIYVDELSMQGCERLRPNDYHLRSHSENDWYIFSATDVVYAQVRDDKDHIEWLLEDGQIYEAYQQSSDVLEEDERKKLGRDAAQVLVDDGNWPEAARVLAASLGDDASQWKTWAKLFMENNEHAAIGNALPDLDLDTIHTDIVISLIKSKDIENTDDLLAEWNLDLLDKSQIIIQLEKSSDFIKTLAQFYLRLAEPYNAVKCFLKINDPRAYELVTKYHLWNEMLPDLEQILSAGNVDEIKRIEQLVTDHLEVSPYRVVEQLEGRNPRIVFIYLKTLSQVDGFLVRDFGDLMVRLYAEYDPKALQSFLKLNSTYSLANAVGVCEAKHLVDELIYLYGRVGRAQEAMNLIINESKDAKRAVHFAVAHKDQELWNYLIDYSRDKPEFVLQLLQCPQVRPAKVLEVVPHSLRIPGLRDTLRKVLNDQRAVLVLNGGALDIVKAEAQHHLAQLQLARKQGRGIAPEKDPIDWCEPIVIGPDSKAVVVAPLKLDHIDKNESWLALKMHHFAEVLQHVSPAY